MKLAIRGTLLTLAGAATLSLTVLSTAGCGAFFVCAKASCPSTGTTGTAATDYAFVSNSASGSTYINGYVVSSGTLVAATDSPISLSFTPQAMAVTPSAAYTNQYLYVASQPSTTCGNCGIYGFQVGTGGALTALNSGGEMITENVSSMDISPDGKWLFVLDFNGQTINQYSINSSTGALAEAAPYSYVSQNSQNSVVIPESIKVAPSGDFFVAALGTGGAVVYAFNTSSGVGTLSSTSINPNNAAGSVTAIGIDANNYLYAAGILLSGNKPGVLSYSVSSSGTLSSSPISSPAVGNGPSAIVVSTNNNYVYVANSTDSTISGFSTSSGALTALNSGTAYNAPTNIEALGRDSSGSYLVGAGYSASSGYQIFLVSSTGTLTESNSAASGTVTSVPVSIAMAH